MRKELLERDRRILDVIITDYILLAEPVGSRTVAKKYGINLSPASIRNIMADLEELGFLYQPHTSAGRIPTDKAFRYYVDSILELKKIDKKRRDYIENSYRDLQRDVSKMLRETSRILSILSKLTGLVMAPKSKDLSLNYVELIKLGPNKILVILLYNTGIVENRFIESEVDLPEKDLKKFTNYINSLSKNLTISEIINKITNDMEKEKTLYDELMLKVFSNEIEEEIYIDGVLNILDYPDFSEIEKMKEIFHAFEEKRILLSILDKALDTDDVQIIIGSEMDIKGINECAVVMCPYYKGGITIGTLGVIGPIRMNYSEVIPLVDFTAKAISKVLEMA
ncbi:MAG: heat-inducible transcriptional repressor HrcA [Spirochaetota bacterium]|nr:heat-inducible transcriptional repressor HrcA [Spirochaetota bacterium]